MDIPNGPRLEETHASSWAEASTRTQSHTNSFKRPKSVSVEVVNSRMQTHPVSLNIHEASKLSELWKGLPSNQVTLQQEESSSIEWTGIDTLGVDEDSSHESSIP